MHLLSQLYLQYEDIYKNQANVKLSNPLSNVADTFSRETMPVLAEAINKLCKQEVSENSVSDQKKWTKNIIIKFNQVNRTNTDWPFPCSTKRFAIREGSRFLEKLQTF